MSKRLTAPELQFVTKRYDELFSFYGMSNDSTIKKVSSELKRKFGKEMCNDSIRQNAYRILEDGTCLHNFFECMIDEFKKKYGKDINRQNQEHLRLRISRFVEREYEFGRLNNHERRVLSEVLGKRKDVVLVENGEKLKYLSGKSKGRLGYFKQ